MQMLCVLVTLLVLTGQCNADNVENPEISAEYLENTIKNLKNNKGSISHNAPVPLHTTPSPVKRLFDLEPEPQNIQQQQTQPPALHLTKAELAAMYQSAVKKGETVQLDPDGGSRPTINAVVHELDTSENNYVNKLAEPNEKDSGYYYYYYPLKTFMDELTGGYHNEATQVKYEDYHHGHHKPDVHYDEEKPYVHSHTHQHKVHIQPMMNMIDSDKKSKALEPLFMAISGFIGMTIMFILSVLVLPKFSKLKPKQFKNDDEEVTSIFTIAMRSIEGEDCRERFICEAGKTAKAFNLYDNRFVKLIKRLSPSSVKQGLNKIGKYMDTKYRCGAIQCKRKNEKSAANQKAQTKVAQRKPAAT